MVSRSSKAKRILISTANTTVLLHFLAKKMLISFVVSKLHFILIQKHWQKGTLLSHSDLQQPLNFLALKCGERCLLIVCTIQELI